MPPTWRGGPRRGFAWTRGALGSPPGSGTCAACSYAGPPTRHGLCPKCGKRLAPAPALPVPRQQSELTGPQAIDPALLRLLAILGMGGIPVGAVVVLAALSSLGQAGPVLPSTSAVLLALAVGLVMLAVVPLFQGASSPESATRWIRECRVGHVVLRGRRAVQIRVEVDPAELERGARVETSVVLRSPRGECLKARNEHYRDPQGNFRVSQVSEPYNTAVHQELTVRLVFPLTALDLVATGEAMEVTVETTVFDGQEVVGRARTPLAFVLSAEDFPPLEIDATGILVTSSGPTAAANCMVCGDALDGTTVRCPACEVPHHEDCWQYNGGCSTYGCHGAPAPR